MAILKIRSASGKGSIEKAKNYLEKENRAEQITTLNIDTPKNWAQEMEQTKKALNKKEGVQHYWIVQSFENEEGNENYNPETVHELGRKLAQHFADEGFQAVVETHTDTDNLHNHIIINSVNAENGNKLQLWRDTEKELYKLNDELCRQAGLRTLDESKRLKDERDIAAGRTPTSRKTDEIYLEQKNKSWKEQMRAGLSRVWKRTDIRTAGEFMKALDDEGLFISRQTSTGNITYQDASGHKARAKGLGGFNGEDVARLLERNLERSKTQLVIHKRETGAERGLER